MGRDDHTTVPADCLTLVMPLQARLAAPNLAAPKGAVRRDVASK